MEKPPKAIVPTTDGSETVYREIACPCCGIRSSERWIEGRELDAFRFYSRLTGFEQVHYVRCLFCGLLYSNPRLLYTESTLETISPQHVARRWKRYQPIQEQLRRNKAKKLERVVQLTGDRRGRFLEIGCGFGFGLEVALECGFDPIGTELYSGFVDACREKGLNAIPGIVDGIPFPDGSCAVVFLDELNRRGMVPQLNDSSCHAQEGAASHAIQFCDFLARKRG